MLQRNIHKPFQTILQSLATSSSIYSHRDDLGYTLAAPEFLLQRSNRHNYFREMFFFVEKWPETAISTAAAANLIFLLSPPRLGYCRLQNMRLHKSQRGKHTNARSDL